MVKKRVLAGMRASGRLHVGNYLGGARGMVALQEDPGYETLYMVADLHAITTPYDKKSLAGDARNVIVDYLSVGLDPEKSTIFIQSHVAEVTELAYYFSSVVSVARMSRLPTYKEKLRNQPLSSSMALLSYPVLMAADILMYKAHLVPVGIDQEPHLEVAREIVKKMNAQYGTNFPEPNRFKTEGEYVPSLTGVGKMSKSVAGSAISLGDDLDTIRERLLKVPTDEGKGESIPETGGVASLLTLVGLFQGEERRSQYERDYTAEGVKYGSLKEELAAVIYDELRPIQERRKELLEKPGYIDNVIREGAEIAHIEAQKTLEEVRERMGIKSKT